MAVGLALGLGSGEGQAWVAVGLALGLGSGEGQAGVAVGLALGLGSGEGRAWVAVGLALGLGLAEGRAVTVQGTSGLDRDRALVDVRGPAAEKGQSPHCAAMVAGLGRIALHRSGLHRSAIKWWWGVKVWALLSATAGVGLWPPTLPVTLHHNGGISR